MGRKIKLLGSAILICLIPLLHSCKQPDNIEAGFEDLIGMTIYDYVFDNDSLYSSFGEILKAGTLDKTLSAYNPDGDGYTLFLPDNKAVEAFIEVSDYSSLEELTSDVEFSRAFSRYHVVNMSIRSDDFPFGALPEYTLSGDYLTVNFVIEEDSSYHKINNQAVVKLPDQEMSNGWVHVLESALLPVTQTTYDWLVEHSSAEGGYSIFSDALELTGQHDLLDVNIKEDENAQAVTLLIEHDSTYAKRDIQDVDDLIDFLGCEDTDYTDPGNALNGYVGYHILKESMFLDDFVDQGSNYTTFSEVPVLIDGNSLDIRINPGKEVFDTVYTETDTTIVDYVLFDIDNSNKLTQSGAIHFIDQVLSQQPPTIASQRYEFYDEPLLTEYRETPGDYLIEDTAALRNFTWWGTDLYFIETGDDEHPAWGGDYMYMNGDFILQYQLPKLVQGTYTLSIRCENNDADNALIEVYVDGKIVGGLVDLSRGGNANWPWAAVEIGSINFSRYEEHVLEVRSLIPGKFSLDFFLFEPYEED